MLKVLQNVQETFSFPHNTVANQFESIAPARLNYWPTWEPNRGNTRSAQAVYAAQYVDYARRNNLQLRWRAFEWYTNNTKYGED